MAKKKNPMIEHSLRILFVAFLFSVGFVIAVVVLSSVEIEGGNGCDILEES